MQPTARGAAVTEPDTGAPEVPEQPEERAAGERRPAWRSPIVVMAAAAVVLVVAVLLATGLGGTDGAGVDEAAEEPREELIDEFSGVGDDTTSAFTVEGRWEIRWETEGEAFQVDLVDGNVDPLETVVDHEGQGGGSNYLMQDGDYRLDVTADGDWSIRVFEHAE